MVSLAFSHDVTAIKNNRSLTCFEKYRKYRVSIHLPVFVMVAALLFFEAETHRKIAHEKTFIMRVVSVLINRQCP